MPSPENEERKSMNNNKLYELLEIPEEVTTQLAAYEKARSKEIPDDIYKKLFLRTEWDEGVKELQTFLGDDPDGIKILWEQLNIVSSYTCGEYIKRGISEDILIATMKFCTRFLHEHHRSFGTYKYVWAWWFPRQISLCEYRIGALEYEFVEGTEREIAVHIPSDADMGIKSIQHSLSDFYQFRDKYFSQWKDVLLTCDSWMLMPELRQFLKADSNIVAFQKMFEIDTINRNATWYMGWIFPGCDKVDDTLPENTLLQRELKQYLLAGNVFGIAKGHIR